MHVVITHFFFSFFLFFMFFIQIRFQPNDHKTIKETADELKIFEGIKHPNLVRYFGVELHRVRRHTVYSGITFCIPEQFGINFHALPCRRRCTSSWSTVTRAPWRRCPDWGCRNMSSGSTVNRSLQPSMSSMSMALSTAISRVSVTRLSHSYITYFVVIRYAESSK